MNKYILLFILSLPLLAACSNNKNNPVTNTPTPATLSTVLVRDIYAYPPPSTNPTASTKKHAYYRLQDSTLVTTSDTLTNKWDIAFSSTTIWVNGGGLHTATGQGGAIVLSGVGNFDTLATVPASGWATDTLSNGVTTLAIPTGSGHSWYNYSLVTDDITTIPGVVFALRTGDGKYAKLQILSYYKGSPQTQPAMDTTYGYYTFRYVYQPDGSRNVK